MICNGCGFDINRDEIVHLHKTSDNEIQFYHGDCYIELPICPYCEQAIEEDCDDSFPHQIDCPNFWIADYNYHVDCECSQRYHYDCYEKWLKDFEEIALVDGYKVSDILKVVDESIEVIQNSVIPKVTKQDREEFIKSYFLNNVVEWSELKPHF